MSFIKKYVSRIADQSQIKNTVQDAKKLLKQQDYFNLMFLKPIQVKLKSANGDSLPEGMQLAIKDDISMNKFKTAPINHIDLQTIKNLDYSQIVAHNLDNGISAMKNPDQGIQVAICVCMYSEDKKMLKSTLSGIHENMDYFVRSGVSSDKIAICVMMDGIQKVDQSVVQYFDELQRECGINLMQNAQQVNPRDIVRNRQAQERYDEEVDDNNSIIFTPGQLKQRQEMRFRVRVQEFQKIRSLKKTAQQLKKTKGLTYDILDPRIQKFFLQVAKQAEKQEVGADSLAQMQHPQDFYVEKYTRDIQTCRSMISIALQKASQHCDQYIRSRQQLALVNYFRTKVFVMRRSKNNGKQEYNNIQDQIDSQEAQACKMNLFMCTKYKNAGKLSSHNWFFNGFCKQFRPKYAILLDVGLRPERQALYRFYKHMKDNPKVGGVCGYMGLKIQRATDQLGYSQGFDEKDLDIVSRLIFKVFDIQRAQQLEYHLAHLLDKPFEALFGFIHVLPGAFSGYNMDALQGRDQQGNTNSNNKILKEYFKSIQQKIDNKQLKQSVFSPFEVVMKTVLPDAIYYRMWPLQDKSEQRLLYNQNIYLAEDRILCMGIHQNKYQMSYIPDAYAWVDPMKNIHTLLGQRKRWINGSFFAFEKVKTELSKSEQCQIGLQIQILFLSFMNVLGYISPSLFLFTVSIAMQVFVTDVLNGVLAAIIPSAVSDAFVYIINFVYIITTSGFIFYSMNLSNRDKKFIPFIYGVSTMLGIFSLGVFAILLLDIIRGSDSFLIENAVFIDTVDLSIDLIQSMRWIIIAIIGLYIIPVFVYMLCFRKFSIVVDLVFSAASFLFYSPTYLNILNIYALCRVNDISWGTKGLDTSSSKNVKTEEAWSVIRLIQVGKYLFWNIVATMFLLTLGSDYITRFWITFGIMVILFLTLFLKALLAVVYILKYACCSKIKDPQPNARIATDSRIHSTFKLCRPQLQKKVQKHLQDTLIKCSKQLNQTYNRGILLGPSQLYSRIDQRKLLQDSFKELAQTNKSRISRIGKRPSGQSPIGTNLRAQPQADPKDKYRQEKININNKKLDVISQEKPIEQKKPKHLPSLKQPIKIQKIDQIIKKQSKQQMIKQEASFSIDQDKSNDKKLINQIKQKPAANQEKFRRNIMKPK